MCACVAVQIVCVWHVIVIAASACWKRKLKNFSDFPIARFKTAATMATCNTQRRCMNDLFNILLHLLMLLPFYAYTCVCVCVCVRALTAANAHTRLSILMLKFIKIYFLWRQAGNIEQGSC